MITAEEAYELCKQNRDRVKALLMAPVEEQLDSAIRKAAELGQKQAQFKVEFSQPVSQEQKEMLQEALTDMGYDMYTGNCSAHNEANKVWVTIYLLTPRTE